MIIDIALCLCFGIALVQGQQNQALIPPSFNIAQGKKITATSTCGDEGKAELYCKLTGNTGDSFRRAEQDIVNGQYCDFCDMSLPLSKHPAEYAIDGTEKWWQSPPLSRGLSYNEVNITIDLGQSYHVAYILLKFANSPRPGVWILEKSTDFGNTYEPWQYFADSDSDCRETFGMESTEDLTSDDQVICTTSYSDIVPLEDGEIVVSLINGRPGSKNFYASDILQDFIRATNVRLRLIKTNTLHGHLMAKQQQDPTVTRRYYYSIKDISIGGRCLCNGHADRCDTSVPEQVGRIMCTCSHNTCGSECQECCPGFVQKKWLPATPQTANECEPCNCFNHATSCYYDEDVDHRGESLDIHGNYSGGGVCINCKDNTAGINCNECKPGYYRVRNTSLTSPSICQRCTCQSVFHTGNCASLTGQCECKPQFTGTSCSECSLGYYGYPECKECRCNVNGTINAECQAQGGQCQCKQNFRDRNCDKCAPMYYNFPYCLSCECSIYGLLDAACEASTGQCRCRVNYAGRACDECAQGFYSYPNCLDCNCHSEGTEGAVCDTNQGRCECKDNFAGAYCDQCASGYFDFPNCNPCNCNSIGTGNVLQCYGNGQCQCLPNYSGIKCDSCSPAFYRYPECIACECDQQGSVQQNCDQVTGQCRCYRNYIGRDCKQCALGFYNFPSCEECNCAPAGVQKQLQGQPIGGCGAETNGACICKDHVTGRSCDECKELYWNLQLTNTNGCEECNCYTPGTISTSQVCKAVSGQCRCKTLVTGRQCTECQDQSYELTGSDVFGCKACECDVGGAINNLCDKSTGKCTCRPRIRGNRCDEPESAHFFYDLYQFRFEIEEGRSTNGGRVRIGYDEMVFSNFSYLGYAIMSESTQPSVIVTVDVVTHVLYRIILCYVHTGADIVRGSIKLSPSDPSIGSEQVHPVLFLPGAGPQLVTVEGGNIISPFVLNPGRWFATIEATGGLLLDYLVLLPSAYYEASSLKQQVAEPCQAGQTQDLCSQPMLSLSFPITVAGEYVLIVEFYRGGTGIGEHTVQVITEQGQDSGFVATYDCYFVCRSVVMDAEGRVKVFVFPEEVFEIKFTKHLSLNKMGLSSIVAVPVEKWNFDLVTPALQCVRNSNKNCVQSTYPDAVSSTKFNVGNTEGSTAPIPPNIYDTNAKLYYMNTDSGKVELLLDDIALADGQWVFIVHYYQPYHSAYTVYFDIVNETQSGSFEAKYCPHVVGCRALVMTTDGSNTFTWLGVGYNIKITLQATDSYDIWIDYILAVPRDMYTPELLVLTKQDRASEFIRECSNHQFYISPSATGFCRDSVFSLSVFYNNGAKSCRCNVHGSTDYFCNQLGGQCPCRERYTGRRCDHCKIGFFDFPNCQRCQCLSGICHYQTGVCVCPPNVIGNFCDACKENYFGYDPIAGCIECDCDPRGTEGDINKCDRVTGQCSCKHNVGGRRCDQCLPGHHSYPFCHVCNCQLPGTVQRVCDEVSAECLCKENVHGEFCHQCDNSTFYLEERNPKGCTSCFCFGITNDCVASSNLYRQEVNTMIGWNVTNVRNNDVILRDNEVSLYVSGTGDDPLATIYWVAPTEYLGYKITSYGGKLRYIVSYRASTLNPANPIRRPDVILSGSSLEIMYSNIYEPNRERQDVELDILEGNFQYTLGCQCLSGICHYQTGVCVCPPNVIGNFCDACKENYFGYDPIAGCIECDCDPRGTEGDINKCDRECADGYYRSGVGLFLGSCIPCECNGHSDQCNKDTGECNYCKHNTDGPSCGSCKSGYYEDSNQNYPFACQLCACPHSSEGNSFAYSCSVSGIVTTCDCLPGYQGTTCGECEDDYYGSPEVVGGDCQPCFCHGNTDPNTVGRRCDRLTGECFCADGYSGFNCDRCTDDYYGDAVNQHNCQKCECNTCGVSRCDNSTGSCTCKPNVVGSNCSRCRSGTWGFSSCQGCLSCDCGIASVMPECNVQTGECSCLPGVGGDKCTRCLRGFWNYGPTGCIECSCPELLECEPVTGDCLCPVGATGEYCDTCEDRYILTQEGCKQCDLCVHQLLDAMQSMILEVNMTTPGEIPLGQADLDRLDQLNDTLWNELKPEVSQVLVNNNMLLEAKLDNMTAELNRTSTRANEIEALSVKIKDSAENEHLPAALNVKQRANNLETFINESYAGLQHIIVMSKNKNITEEQDGLQESMAIARRIVTEIESSNFTAAEEASRKEYIAARMLLNNVTHLNQDVQGFLTHLMNVTSHLEHDENDINDVIGWSNDANRSVSESKKINADNLISKGNLKVDIHLSNSLFTNGTRKIEDSNELLALARSYLIDAQASNTNLTEDYTRLVAGIKRFAPVVKTLMEDLEGTEDLVDQAGEHAKNLTAYAARLVELSKTGVEYAELADQAAKAYSDIVDAIDNAKISANDSLAAAEIAKQQSENLKADKALKKSKKKLDEAKEAEKKLDEELEPIRMRVEAFVQELHNTNFEVNYNLQMLKNEINDLPEVDSEEARKAFNLSMQAEQVANASKNIIDTAKTNITLTESILEDVKANINISTKALDDAEEKSM
ncbi:laminin subunit alpha-like [Anneissia japonica]|uniref:laminin subunit alpha-like n=1 Tax=Anneissia japonica TaxID=1529436 RepID=UPI00142566B0|nr:laminin subunit alpha-like [Anneissia japonica]